MCCSSSSSSSSSSRSSNNCDSVFYSGLEDHLRHRGFRVPTHKPDNTTTTAATTTTTTAAAADDAADAAASVADLPSFNHHAAVAKARVMWTELCQHCSSVRCIVDVGCAEGLQTSTIARISKLPPECVHGCDVRRMNTVPGFTFRVCTPNGDLPYGSGSVDVVVCSMLLHHVHDVAKVIREAHRVLRPGTLLPPPPSPSPSPPPPPFISVAGGVLVIREHDCSPAEYAVVIDVIHVMYAPRPFHNVIL